MVGLRGAASATATRADRRDLAVPDGVEVINPDPVLATLTGPMRRWSWSC